MYSINCISNSKERKCVRAFKDGWENIHDEPRSGRPSVITQEKKSIFTAIDKNTRKDWRLQFKLFVNGILK